MSSQIRIAIKNNCIAIWADGLLMSVRDHKNKISAQRELNVIKDTLEIADVKYELLGEKDGD